MGTKPLDTAADRAQGSPMDNTNDPTPIRFPVRFQAAAGTDWTRWELFGAFFTAEERDAFVARFPKSAGVKATTLGSSDGTWPAVSAVGNLHANGVTGAANETAVRRYRTIARIAPEIPWRTGLANALDRDTFERIID